jgi:L-asparaginase II
VHRGVVTVISADGSVLTGGAATAPMYPRSANKPFQAAAMLRCGLDLDDELLALAAASHSGEDFHVAGVRKILAGAGLTEEDLRCPPDRPLDERTWEGMVRAGEPADRAHMNCSGKHAAMLATCVAARWPTASYTDPGHPLQQRIIAVLANLAGEPVTMVGVDGCGAPLLAVSVAGLARAFRAMVLAAPRSPERRVADAMRAHPEWTSGTARPERALMAAVPGLLLKSGAEGVEGFALPDGRAGAFKIDDGAARGRVPVTVALLRRLGADAEPRADRAVLDELGTSPVSGGGRIVGEIRAARRLLAW